MRVLAWDVPIVKTQPVRELLGPFLLSHRDVQSLLSLDDRQNRLLLHPRIQSEEDLPAGVVSACHGLGAQSCFHVVQGLDPILVEQLWTVVFFSGSKPSIPLLPGLPDTWRRVLSNFYPTSLVIEDKSFVSIEHFFQSQKALASTRPEMADWFSSDFEGPQAVDPVAAAAKKAGSRKFYRQHNAILDIDLWEARRVDCMRLALDSRYEQDELFRRVLDSTKRMGLLHFERAGARSFWGGSFSRQDGKVVGNNQLGVLMMQLRDRESS